VSWAFNWFLTWFGLTVDYVIAAGMIAGGLYLAVLFDLAVTNPLYWILRPIRWVGLALAIGGLSYGVYTYGKTVGVHEGASACYQEWQQKNYEARIAKLEQEANIKAEAAAKAEQALAEIASQADALQKQVDDYADEVKTLPKVLADCRRANDDDNKRLCQLTGNTDPGCKASPTKRKTRPARPATKAGAR
jgi:hypothetical protein